jgi:hypothetical protein
VKVALHPKVEAAPALHLTHLQERPRPEPEQILLLFYIKNVYSNL